MKSQACHCGELVARGAQHLELHGTVKYCLELAERHLFVACSGGEGDKGVSKRFSCLTRNRLFEPTVGVANGNTSPNADIKRRPR